jgi:hypothetical protein
MTKTTNFEISKKLAEIGFKAKTVTEKCWVKPRMSTYDYFTLTNFYFQVPAYYDDWFPSYDLETLLNALPEKIKVGIDRTPQSKLYFDKISFGNINFFINRTQENESLADILGRFIIYLHEKNLIKF